VREISAIGVLLLLLAVWGGQFVHGHESLAQHFTLRAETLAWAIIVYGLAASVLPVWLLLAPRDYLSTFMKLGTIFVLVLGVFLVLPDLKMKAVSQFVDGSGLVVAGKLFPFCFITIACGAISGFHTLISSGVTPKIITRESYARNIGYGAMCMESLVAIMAMVAACTLEPGVYLCMNIKGAGPDAAAVAADTVARVTATGFPITVEHMDALARQIGEKTLFGRTGGAATLAVGMAQILSQVTRGRWLDLWYHFAIMFEALFILTTLDAGTRVGRYLLHDVLGAIWRPLGNTKSLRANLVVSTLMVASWGYFLIQGVRDPLGGINSLWPLFGVANQMLAAIALCLATTIILKTQLRAGGESKAGRPVFALVTLIPLVWLISVTFTAGYQKIFDVDPRIGFLAQARVLDGQLPVLEKAVAEAQASVETAAMVAARKELRVNRTLRFNNLLDAVAAGTFLLLAGAIVVLSLREWILLLARKRLAVLHEAEPVWLPNGAVVESKPLHFLSLIAVAGALARELSGEAEIERYQQAAAACTCDCHHDHDAAQANLEPAHSGHGLTRTEAYVLMTENRFRGVKRCC
jgi:carbon starvation protein